mmetsp:Transcript_32935/g.129301  ORF Transcript_32935/g.129301 Transcript_32935/m.129301 type:complete len:114 (+) Transcript_32935:1091-1432(+)
MKPGLITNSLDVFRKQELKQAARESQCVMMGLMNASPPSKLAPSNVSPASHEERDVTGGELDKLCPNHRHFRLSGSTRTGGEGDSYYEYLLKVGCWSLPGTIPVAMEQEGPRT